VALAECLLCQARAIQSGHRPCRGRSILDEVTPSTGEPCAGDPPARFGGRGARTQSGLPTPIIATRCGVQRDSPAASRPVGFHVPCTRARGSSVNRLTRHARVPRTSRSPTSSPDATVGPIQGSPDGWPRSIRWCNAAVDDRPGDVDRPRDNRIAVSGRRVRAEVGCVPEAIWRKARTKPRAVETRSVEAGTAKAHAAEPEPLSAG